MSICAQQQLGSNCHSLCKLNCHAASSHELGARLKTLNPHTPQLISLAQTSTCTLHVAAQFSASTPTATVSRPLHRSGACISALFTHPPTRQLSCTQTHTLVGWGKGQGRAAQPQQHRSSRLLVFTSVRQGANFDGRWGRESSDRGFRMAPTILFSPRRGPKS
jgi:hypothetical protein